MMRYNTNTRDHPTLSKCIVTLSDLNCS